MNPTESILQEASQTSAWFDNFAFFTEGVFMVSIDNIHLWWVILSIDNIHWHVDVNARSKSENSCILTSLLIF